MPEEFDIPKILKKIDEPTELERKTEFINEHEVEIIPLLGGNKKDESLLEKIRKEKPLDENEKKEVDEILEKFETKVFLYEKPAGDFEPDAKRFFLTASEIMAYQIMSPIIGQLKEDRRCRSIGLLTDDLAGKEFEERLGGDFKRVDNKELPVMADALKTAETAPFDIAITAVDRPNTPKNIILFGGKSIFGAKRLFVIVGGWIGFGGDRILSKKDRQDHMEKIDGIFCNDEIAKRVILSQNENFPVGRIFTCGTPVIDGAEKEKTALNAKTGRKKLGIGECDLAILYAGDSSASYRQTDYQTDENINEKTFEKSLDAIIEAAKNQPEKKISLLLRPHPSDSNSQELFELVKKELPANLKIISATNKDISMPEAISAADMTISIVGNINFLARLCGRRAVFLGYQEKGLGNEVLAKTWNKEVQAVIKEDKKIRFFASPAEFAEYLKAQEHTFFVEKENHDLPKGKKSSEKILDIIFEKNMINKEAVVVLSAGVKKNEKGEWVSTDLTLTDAKASAPGGKSRVIAASYLFKENPDVVLIVTGGRGWGVVNDEPGRPDLCDILKRELIELGIPSEKIITENKSNKTFEQLQELKKIFKNEKFKKIKIISNEYHLTRVKVMAEVDSDLRDMLDNSQLELISAEKVLLDRDKEHWSEIIKNIYDSEIMKQIINNENKGAKQIKEGTYKFG